MFYTVYKTTNKCNGKIYIGAHKTENLEDGYLGSGYLFRYALKKYGRENFTKEILFFLSSEEDMYNKERELVTEEFVHQKTNYNIRPGGSGGFSSEEAKKGRAKTEQLMIERYGFNWRNIYFEAGREKRRSEHSSKWKTDLEYREKILTTFSLGSLASRSEEAKQKRKETMKASGHSQGKKNNQFGKMWIYNLETLESKSIPKTEVIPEGWIKGRKMISNKEIIKGFLELTQDVAKQQGYSRDDFSDKDRGKLLELVDDEPTEIVNPSEVGKILNSYKE